MEYIAPAVFVIAGIVYAALRNNKRKKDEEAVNRWDEAMEKSYLFDKDGKPYG